MAAAAGGRIGLRWASPFPPTNSVDARRFDDVTLTANARSNGGFGRGIKTLTTELEESSEQRHGAGSASLRFCDGDSSDGGSDYEVAAPGGRVVFDRAPKVPWSGGQLATDELHGGGSRKGGGGWSDQVRHQTAVLHRAVHTRPLFRAPSGSGSSPWPSSPSAEAAGGGGNCKPPSRGFSLRRLFRIGGQRSRSRSRSSATPTLTTTPTPQSRSHAPSGGVNGGAALAMGQRHSQLAGSMTNGFGGASSSSSSRVGGDGGGSGGGFQWRRPVARSSTFNTDIVLARDRHPAPNNFYEGRPAATRL